MRHDEDVTYIGAAEKFELLGRVRTLQLVGRIFLRFLGLLGLRRGIGGRLVLVGHVAASLSLNERDQRDDELGEADGQRRSPPPDGALEVARAILIVGSAWAK